MLVKVLYFASLREQLNVTEEEVELAEDSTVSDLLHLLRKRGEDWQQLLGSQARVRVAVELEFATLATKLAEGYEVGLFPPVTGG